MPAQADPGLVAFLEAGGSLADLCGEAGGRGGDGACPHCDGCQPFAAPGRAPAADRGVVRYHRLIVAAGAAAPPCVAALPCGSRRRRRAGLRQLSRRHLPHLRTGP